MLALNAVAVGLVGKCSFTLRGSLLSKTPPAVVSVAINTCGRVGKACFAPPTVLGYFLFYSFVVSRIECPIAKVGVLNRSTWVALAYGFSDSILGSGDLLCAIVYGSL